MKNIRFYLNSSDKEFKNSHVSKSTHDRKQQVGLTPLTDLVRLGDQFISHQRGVVERTIWLHRVVVLVERSFPCGKVKPSHSFLIVVRILWIQSKYQVCYICITQLITSYDPFLKSNLQGSHTIFWDCSLGYLSWEIKPIL